MNHKSPPSIKVYGTGEINVMPNQALITIGAVTEGKDLQAIQKENASIINLMIQQFTTLGIEQSLIQTADYRIEPVYEYREEMQLLKGYKVSHLLQLTVRELDKIGLLIDTAVKSGANNVTDIQFTVENDQLIYLQALQQAVVEAQTKAFSLAKQVGAQIHTIPYLIEEEPTNQVYPLGRYKTFAAAESTPIQPGLQTVTAKVRAEFYYC
ncbi:SIMPL domain-containing protein [Bacillus sp. DJP31]|uniref:SIMPL domain-containing protein n=1 Tax=Bacillus sp. DJP31 TaxID=3409789 RepID=UPI003BB58A87